MGFSDLLSVYSQEKMTWHSWTSYMDLWITKTMFHVHAIDMSLKLSCNNYIIQPTYLTIEQTVLWFSNPPI